MKNNYGFTLIEVLVALAIFAIALTAIMKATSQHIRDHHYIQNKTIAIWVASDIINQARVGLLQASDSSDTIEKETEMLGQSWPWKAEITTTASAKTKQIQVDVFQKTPHIKLVTLTGYFDAEKK